MTIETIIGISALIVSIIAIGISIWAIISGKKSSDKSIKDARKIHAEQILQTKTAHTEQMIQNQLIANEQLRRESIQSIREENKLIREHNKKANSAGMLKSEIPESENW